MAFLAKQIIRGSEARGDGDSAYMTRYAFPRILGMVRPCLHIFHRSDADELHDHPWGFVSVILWRGYIEETPTCHNGDVDSGWVDFEKRYHYTNRKRVWPGMILFRPATHVHRVELIDGKKAVTLVFMGVRRREWGFFTSKGWKQWQAYFKERGC
jgi:hypothetical protein